MGKDNRRRVTAAQVEKQSAREVRKFEKRVIEFAGQIGWILGTAEAKTHKWLDPAQLTDKLTRIRDHAQEVLNHLKPNVSASTTAPQPARQAVAADLVHAPGKRHRKAPPAVHGIKHSDERIAKGKAAAQNRRGPSQRG